MQRLPRASVALFSTMLPGKQSLCTQRHRQSSYHQLRTPSLREWTGFLVAQGRPWSMGIKESIKWRTCQSMKTSRDSAATDVVPGAGVLSSNGLAGEPYRRNMSSYRMLDLTRPEVLQALEWACGTAVAEMDRLSRILEGLEVLK